ncbi:40S ribosomal protein S10-1 [Camellia lanceoleosa]|uniref:40S ribosomal protein S10-1 n=1 Tax=Camellia lanceoleosa TaxID=1840588 RepID=A0ACC0IBL1_9ERIC|nr:40S ribosomal protein S10-1 [Camellia lanceoleosa]
MCVLKRVQLSNVHTLLKLHNHLSTPSPSSLSRSSSPSEVEILEKNCRKICKFLFQEGVCYAKKDFNLVKHLEIDVQNLQVIKLMRKITVLFLKPPYLYLFLF